MTPLIAATSPGHSLRDFKLDPIMLIAFLAPPFGTLGVGIPSLAYYIIQVRIHGKTDVQDFARNTCIVSAVALFLSFATSAVGHYTYSVFATASSIGVVLGTFTLVLDLPSFTP